MKKRGQFYLIAALVIIGVIASLATVYNSIKVSEEDIAVYDLSDEINYEALQLLDSGSFYTLGKDDIQEYIRSLVDYYSELNPETDIVVIYGTKTKVTIVAYLVQTSGSINTIGAIIDITQKVLTIEELDISGNDLVKIKLGTVEYIFDVKEEGQNFFLVLKKEGDGDIFVSTTEQEPAPECVGETC